MYFPLLLNGQNPILQSTVTCLKRFPLIRKNVSLSTIWQKNINAARSLGMDGIVFNGNIDDVQKSDWFLISRNQSHF